MRSVWNRRWFEILAAGSLRYVSESKVRTIHVCVRGATISSTSIRMMSIHPLTFEHVKPEKWNFQTGDIVWKSRAHKSENSDGFGQFWSKELLLASNYRSFILQADNEWELKDWIDALQVASTTPPEQPIVLPHAPKVTLIRDSVCVDAAAVPYTNSNSVVSPSVLATANPKVRVEGLAVRNKSSIRNRWLGHHTPLIQVMVDAPSPAFGHNLPPFANPAPKVSDTLCKWLSCQISHKGNLLRERRFTSWRWI